MTREDAIDKMEHLIISPVGREEIDETCYEVMKYLAAQQPRLMSLEEVVQAETNSEPIWCEFVDCVFGSWCMGWVLKTKSKREIQHVLENYFERAIVWESEYGKGWRCWTSRPTDAQREAVKWDDNAS